MGGVEKIKKTRPVLSRDELFPRKRENIAERGVLF